MHAMFDLTYTLVKFSKSPSGHSRIISTVNFRYMISFDFIYFIHCNISSERNLLVTLRKVGNKYMVCGFAAAGRVVH